MRNWMFCLWTIYEGKESSLGQMTNNIKQIDLLGFKGKIKKSSFYLKSKETIDSDYNLDVLISINI